MAKDDEEEESPHAVGHAVKNPNFNGALSSTDAPAGRSGARRIRAPLFLVWTLSVSYIVMVYISLPLVINVITTRERIHKGEIDPNTNEILASSVSQFRYTWVLAGQRVATLLTSNLIGALSDVYGRKPLILIGVSGYLVTVSLFLIGWYRDSWVSFLVGSISLGCVTPIIPLVIAAAGDVADSVTAFALYSSYVFGIQNFGLLAGLLATIGLRVGLANEPYFVGSFILAGLLAAVVFFVIACFWEESLPKEKRKPKLNWKLANPFGFLFVVTRNPYVFCLWAANCLYWFSVGASEAVFANWWMLRYFVTDTQALPLLWFLISTWVFSGTGQFVLPRCYIKLCGLKLLLHISIVLGIVTSVVVSYAETPAISYVGTSINFWASPAPPALLTLFLAQSETSAVEGGAMTGVYRASQAGFRMIGSAAIGSYFADFIAPYTPDRSCVPKAYNGQTNKAHSCDCGVKGCPVNGTWLPSVCTYGRLTPVASTVPELSPQPTKKLIALGIADRCGTPFFGAARQITVARAWCAGPDPWIGCQGLDVAALTRDGQIAAVMTACWGQTYISPNKTIRETFAPTPLSPTPARLTSAPTSANNTTNGTRPATDVTSAPTPSNATNTNSSRFPTPSVHNSSDANITSPTSAANNTNVNITNATNTSRPTPSNTTGRPTSQVNRTATNTSQPTPNVTATGRPTNQVNQTSEPTPLTLNTSRPTPSFAGIELANSSTSNASSDFVLSPPHWLGGARCNATTMAALHMNASAAGEALRQGKLVFSNQTLDPVRRNKSLSIYAREACPEEGTVVVSLCRAGSLGPRPEEPSMFMFFWPILAAYIFYVAAELCFRRHQKVPQDPEPQGMFTACCQKKPVLPATVPLPNRSSMRENKHTADQRRESEAEVMLPQDPLATLKRDQAWDTDAVIVYKDSPEPPPFIIHAHNAHSTL